MSEKREKRGTIKGFDGVKGEATAKRIQNWSKNQPEGKWRSWGIEKTRYTYLTKTLSYQDNVYTELFICPYGMKKSIAERMSDARQLNALPDRTKEALKLPSPFEKTDIRIKVTDDGDKGFAEFQVLFCKKCTSKDGYWQVFVTKYKDLLPSEPKLVDVWDNWDIIIDKHPGEMQMLDLVGCIIPNMPEVNAGPQANKFIIRPTEHASSKCHK